jgi:DtxR family manganese transport transcriptional regulator
MAKRAPDSNPFSRKRNDHSAETGEDYVELVADLIDEKGEARTVDLAKRLGVTPVTVSKTIQRLEKAGLVKTEPYRSIFLTEKGRQVAADVKTRHETLEAFLVSIGVPPEIASQDSEGMEHHISRETLDCMKQRLRRGKSKAPSGTDN